MHRQIPVWLAVVIGLVPVGGAIGAGVMHVAALEQRLQDQGGKLSEFFMLLTQIVNAILGGG